ncbi:Putative Mg2+ transporter protein, CorA-like/Zinc transport protein ZntB [Septoria linicola]|uniref:Mg2+ transporter protein, CorA-like/Zinc transport protein ZntB n=1 Tax=Septoria linicola TaxID=215465 RepID=A0A9Q9AZP6_9PEZI|nr:Putative Mg2+ transporter protein, CorA-like/Zinc transport protein ZntB [Septoria linicola]
MLDRWEIFYAAISDNIHEQSKISALATPESQAAGGMPADKSTTDLGDSYGSVEAEKVSGGDPPHDDQAESAIFALDDSIVTSANITQCYDTLTNQLKVAIRELDQAFQLLSIGIQVSHAAATKRQAKRATALTVIATIYLPATLAVGAFGINIKGLGGDVDVKMADYIVHCGVCAICHGTLDCVFERE